MPCTILTIGPMSVTSKGPNSSSNISRSIGHPPVRPSSSSAHSPDCEMTTTPVQQAHESEIDSREWDLRVQLAAAYRIIDYMGWSELIWTHTTVRVPGPEHHFLINPYGLRFDEVRASNLVKVDMNGNIISHQC